MASPKTQCARAEPAREASPSGWQREVAEEGDWGEEGGTVDSAGLEGKCASEMAGGTGELLAGCTSLLRQRTIRGRCEWASRRAVVKLRKEL